MWGATPVFGVDSHQYCVISIRAPLCGVRLGSPLLWLGVHYFNPRTPMWGATIIFIPLFSPKGFQSAHPYVGCDTMPTVTDSQDIISIRAPLCGVRLSIINSFIIIKLFQSAHPYVGCDHCSDIYMLLVHPYFNPRTPMWGATPPFINIELLVR